MSISHMQSNPHVEFLPWDTAHYGFGVGRIRGEVRTDQELVALLERAKAENVKLVYLLHTAPRAIDPVLLRDFGGERVRGYVRFGRELGSSPPATASVDGIEFEEFHGSDSDPHLIALGVAAGWLSRFRADQRLPSAKCDELYAIWTARSIRREIADEVLVARLKTVPVGFISFSISPEQCEIGLVSIAETVRGRGIGKALMAFTHERMYLRNVRRSEVVTQTENLGACRLYESTGYAVQERGEYYHFLLDPCMTSG